MLMFLYICVVWNKIIKHCNCWLLIEYCLYLKRLASQSKVCSLFYATIHFDMCHIGCCFYDCNDYKGRWTDWQLKFQTSYFVITSAIYIDSVMLRQKKSLRFKHVFRGFLNFVIFQFLYYGSERTLGRPRYPLRVKILYRYILLIYNQPLLYMDYI